MRSLRASLGRWLAALILAALNPGCSSSPRPETPDPPPAAAADSPDAGFSGIQTGASDSVAASPPGSGDALYRYRFEQYSPASDRFVFQDRELSFYFRPAPDALHFQVENRQDRPAWIEWERSVFYDPRGGSGKVAHATTRWQDRFSVQPETQIVGLQRYSDYLLPLDYLVDPVGRREQLHRPLFPEDASAPQYDGREFGVDLAFRLEGRPRIYSFRFRVASVIRR